MLTGYRSIILALGLILCGATPPEKQAVHTQAPEQVEPSSSSTPDYTPYPDKYAEACYGSKNHDSADLCAQWRAAIAAEKAAETTRWGNIIAGIGAALSFFSIVLVICALRQTEKSLQIAQKDRATATRRAIAADIENQMVLKATREHADAAILSQQSQPFIANISVDLVPDNGRTIVKQAIMFGNAGSSAFKLIKIAAKFRLESGLAPNPSPLKWFDDEFEWIVPPNTNVNYRPKNEHLEHAHEDVIRTVLSPNHGLWIYGAIQFSDRITGTRIQRFCYQVVFRENDNRSYGFTHDGGKDYWSDIVVGD